MINAVCSVMIRDGCHVSGVRQLDVKIMGRGI